MENFLQYKLRYYMFNIKRDKRHESSNKLDKIKLIDIYLLQTCRNVTCQNWHFTRLS